MKKIIKSLGLIILITIIGLSISACNEDENNPNNPTSFDMTAEEFVASMTIGWNLGNTLDSGWSDSFNFGWGNPKTTQENIDTLKNAGFNTLRIPVSWTIQMNKTTYQVNSGLMSRAKEIADYAVNNDMYIIINTHHDEGTFKFKEAEKEQSLIAFKKVWEQISENFKDYDEKLIFEALNEPRTRDSAAEWSGGTPEEHAVLNEYYQVFVDTVRASGGNNDKRFLMVNTYAASAEKVAMDALVIPTDTVPNKIIVQIHAYTPWEFALKTDAPYETTWSETNSSSKNGPSGIKAVFDRAEKTFIEKGYPVVMGEFGALDRSNEDPNNIASRVAWAEYYTGYARSKGIPCVLWDNGVFEAEKSSDEVFGFFKRSNNTFPYPEYRDALLRGAGVLK